MSTTLTRADWARCAEAAAERGRIARHRQTFVHGFSWGVRTALLHAPETAALRRLCDESAEEVVTARLDEMETYALTRELEAEVEAA